ncbi:kinase-like protein [Mollisia scopiformis]|uniref:Kinase-like protein n=1 Tax=Mollisia scopiformis TaxID=149040 RepID=A0A194WY05_MOLSC|nr:kinase-like protein [Mollisia scopiformis]KUJ12482.1 kinase-like protein [Mollisia scopiformis]
MIEGPPWDLEKIHDYERGGHHPVHLEDILDKRYKVIHKLGSGGYANVWLCRDVTSEMPRYVAVKIIMAEASTKECPELRVNKLVQLGLDKDLLADHFCLPLDQFEIDGPNDLHYCLVYPVLGPRVSRLLNVDKLRDTGKALRQICFQAIEAMAALHSHGICHGDFRPTNILARISGLDGLTEDEVFGALGKPKSTKVVTVSGDSHNESTAPQHLVYPISWDNVELSDLGANFITNTACIIDFGESFEVSDLPSELGIPQIYCSPEYTLDNDVGISSDIWALGCTLFEIRTGRKLFDTFDDDPDEYLCKVATILGRFPEPWWSTTWRRRKELFEDSPDENRRVVEIRRDSKPEDAKTDTTHDEDKPRITIMHPPEARSLQDALAAGLFYENRGGPGGMRWGICQEEIDLFSNLLAMIFNFNPRERLTPQAVLKHAWFEL